jgi:hypothetical protein
MRAKGFVLVLSALAASGCVPEWARQGDSPEVLLMTGINDGSPITSDVRISTGTVCPDFATLRLENHRRNPLNTDASFRADIVVERYDVRYFRSDGRSTEGVDVPFRISGNVAQEIQAGNAASLNVEIVRRQAKLEPPLRNLVDLGGAQVVTMFAEVTVYARSTINQTTNSVSARVQVDFADFADSLTQCAAQ